MLSWYRSLLVAVSEPNVIVVSEPIGGGVGA